MQKKKRISLPMIAVICAAVLAAGVVAWNYYIASERLSSPWVTIQLYDPNRGAPTFTVDMPNGYHSNHKHVDLGGRLGLVLHSGRKGTSHPDVYCRYMLLDPEVVGRDPEEFARRLQVSGEYFAMIQVDIQKDTISEVNVTPLSSGNYTSYMFSAEGYGYLTEPIVFGAHYVLSHTCVGGLDRNGEVPQKYEDIIDVIQRSLRGFEV
jgi:hypothetical protein